MTDRSTRETLDAMRTDRLLQTQRIVALVLAASSSACSIGIKPVQPGWDGTEEPDCTDDEGLVWADGIAAGLLLGVGTAAGDAAVEARNEGESSTGADVTMAVGFAGGLVFLISALIGESKYKACHEAFAQWRIGGAIGNATARNRRERRDELTPAEEKKRKRLAKQASAELPAPPQAATPRGFYCADSSTVGFCVRDKAECERTREVSIDAAPDISECMLTEKAWCMGDLCFPTGTDCSVRAEKAGSGASCEQRE